MAQAGTFAAEPASPPIDFNRDIRPILSNHCHKCHGPDEKERKGGTDGLRLDMREAGDRRSGRLRGDRARATWKRARWSSGSRPTDADERMPPKETGKPLTPREIELLKRWVEQGAPYAQHWSYVKPVRPPLPAVKQQRLAAERDRPFHPGPAGAAKASRRSPEADRAALIRRVSLDLTGLPPTLEDVETSSRGESDRYEAYVDKLLDSPAYGEHWAHAWLDLARYADSAGYADDPPRTIWPYRDYVIRSLNANKPFDQFTIEQIAGDLLPEPTDEQLIATAFHRNTLTNNEGGTNDEEFRNVAVVDRVNTTLAVWMGTTMACAQCHSHKYDPITQEEYFRFFAFFNNTEDADRSDESPMLSRYCDRQQKLRSSKAEMRSELAAEDGSEPSRSELLTQAQWKRRTSDEGRSDEALLRPLDRQQLRGAARSTATTVACRS